MSQQKFVYKLIRDNKDRQNKANIDELWKQFMNMPDKATMKPGTKEPMLENKKQLIEIIEALERDNLVMYAADDNAVIMI